MADQRYCSTLNNCSTVGRYFSNLVSQLLSYFSSCELSTHVAPSTIARYGKLITAVNFHHRETRYSKALQQDLHIITRNDARNYAQLRLKKLSAELRKRRDAGA
jgi:hypothetical protein